MRSFLIIPSEDRVCVDNAVATVDCSSLPSDIALVIWSGWIGRYQYQDTELHDVFYDPMPYAYLIDGFIANASLNLQQAKDVKNGFMDAIVAGRRITPWYEAIATGNYYWDVTDPAMIYMIAVLSSSQFYKKVLITDPATTSWTVPFDCVPSGIGTAEGLGSGANAAPYYSGGGGAWGRKRLIQNPFSPGNVYSLHIGSTTGSSDTWFINSSTFLIKGAVTYNRGLASACVADVAFNGGMGASVGGYGGGGAAGPHGPGGDRTPGAGGAGDAGYGGAGGGTGVVPSGALFVQQGGAPGAAGGGEIQSGGGGGGGMNGSYLGGDPGLEQEFAPGRGAPGGNYGAGGGTTGQPAFHAQPAVCGVGTHGVLLITYPAVGADTKPWLPLNMYAPVNITGNELSSIVGGDENRRNSLEFACAAKKAQVNALTTVAQVVAYDSTTGWP